MAIEIVSFPIKMVIFHSYVSLPEGTPYHLKKNGVSGTCGTLSNPAKQCVTISPSHPTGPWHVQRMQRVQRHQASLWICVGTSLSQVLDEMMAASKLSEAHKNASTNMGLIWIKRDRTWWEKKHQQRGSGMGLTPLAGLKPNIMCGTSNQWNQDFTG